MHDVDNCRRNDQEHFDPTKDFVQIRRNSEFCTHEIFGGYGEAHYPTLN